MSARQEFSALLQPISEAGIQFLKKLIPQDTANGLGDSTGDITLIFARGTSEGGNVGLSVGPPFYEALRKKIPANESITFQGVEYPAAWDVFLYWGTNGAMAMAGHVRSAIAHNPKTKIVLSGYSQGALVARCTVKLLTPEELAYVKSIVLFGDPLFATAMERYPHPTRIHEFTHPDDIFYSLNMGTPISSEGAIIKAHGGYAANADEAADRVVEDCAKG